ncbi:MAG TPA: hypothetical protein VND23_00890 [Acidimicrobiales bacterium]|nr:hypothetical protein [Acidimicrobiales bacterium]
MSRPRRVASVAATAICAGVLAAGCSGGSGTLGRHACAEVATSLRQFDAAQRSRDAHAASALRASALTALRRALPLAALAASSDGQWQALEATLSESSRVPESELVSALVAQCTGSVSLPS